MCNIIKNLLTGLFLNLLYFGDIDASDMQPYSQYNTASSQTISIVNSKFDQLITSCYDLIKQIKEIFYYL